MIPLLLQRRNHVARADSDRLIAFPSSSVRPVAPVLRRRSLPPRSTIHSLEIASFSPFRRMVILVKLNMRNYERNNIITDQKLKFSFCKSRMQVWIKLKTHQCDLLDASLTLVQEVARARFPFAYHR